MKICVGAWPERNHFNLHTNPRKTHFEATANISVGLGDYQNEIIDDIVQMYYILYDEIDSVMIQQISLAFDNSVPYRILRESRGMA